MRDNKHLLTLTRKERASARILVVEPDDESRKKIVFLLKMGGFGKISETSSHQAALYKFQGRRFTHMIFSARRVTLPVREWLAEALDLNPGMVAIAVSDNPSLDDIFSLLVEGGRGFLVKPFTADSLDCVVCLATKRDPLSSKVRQAGEPITAILAMMMTSLDNLAIIRRHAKQFETALRDLAYAQESLQQTAELFRLLTKAKQHKLLDAMQTFFVKKSSGPASPLGRLRKRLSHNRGYYTDGRG